MGLVEDVFVQLRTEGEMDVAKINKEIMSLGLNLRLAGRDLMRMGGSLQRVGQWMMSFGLSTFKSSDIIQDAMGDVELALLDAFERTGILDTFADALEKIADILDQFPQLAIGVFILLLIGLLVTIIGKVFAFVGFLKLWIGSMLSARDAGLGWGATIKAGIGALMGFDASMKENIITMIMWKEYAERTGKSLEEMITEAKEFQKQLDAQLKAQKKNTKGTTTMAKGLIMAGAAIGGTLLAMVAFGPIMEAIGPILDALGDAFQSVADALEETGIIEMITDWIEHNKELAVSIILALVLLPLMIKGVKLLSPLLGAVGDKLGILQKDLGGATDETAGADKGFNKTLLLMLALIPEVIGLIFAFTAFIKVAAETGFTITEIGVLLAILVANLGGLLAIIAGVTKILEGINKISSTTLMAFLALAGVALLLIGAFTLFVAVASTTSFTVEGIAVLLTILTANISAILLVIAAVTSLLNNMNSVGTSTIGMLITLAGIVVALILAFAYFLEVASATGFQVGEINTLITGLTAALIVFLAALVIAVVVLASLSVTAAMAMPVVALLLGIGAAALLVGAGFFLAGLGVKMAAEGILNLASNVSSLIVLLPIVLTLIPAFLGLSAAIILVGASSLMASAGIIALSGAIFLLTAALLALSVPLGIIRALGGTGAVIAAIQKIPTLEEGGIVATPGLAYLHPEEEVTPAGVTPLPGVREGYKPKEGPLVVSVDITGAKSVEDIVKKTIESSIGTISANLEKKYRRSEY